MSASKALALAALFLATMFAETRVEGIYLFGGEL